jgi:hypothetical protein
MKNGCYKSIVLNLIQNTARVTCSIVHATRGMKTTSDTRTYAAYSARCVCLLPSCNKRDEKKRLETISAKSLHCVCLLPSCNRRVENDWKQSIQFHIFFLKNKIDTISLETNMTWYSGNFENNSSRSENDNNRN